MSCDLTGVAKMNDKRNQNGTREGIIRAAIYARYSSDLQRESSIEDQIRKCREYAERHGYEVLDEYVCYDKAITGTGVADRKALQRLLDAVEQQPRPFDRLLVDDTSRLARNVED